MDAPRWPAPSSPSTSFPYQRVRDASGDPARHNVAHGGSRGGSAGSDEGRAGWRRTPLAFTWARVKRSKTGFFTLISIGYVVRAVDMVRNRFAMKRVRQRSAAAGFPLDRNMALCVTPERLLIWRVTTRPRRIGTVLGSVPRSQIAWARLPFTGGGLWRTVQVRTTDGIQVNLQVEAAQAERCVVSLGGDTGDQGNLRARSEAWPTRRPTSYQRPFAIYQSSPGWRPGVGWHPDHSTLGPPSTPRMAGPRSWHQLWWRLHRGT